MGFDRKVDQFCCLDDVLEADGGCDVAVMARIRIAQRTVHEYLVVLTS